MAVEEFSLVQFIAGQRLKFCFQHPPLTPNMWIAPQQSVHSREVSHEIGLPSSVVAIAVTILLYL